jgi:hypothetical protein
VRLASLALGLAACGRLGFDDRMSTDARPRADAPGCTTCDQGLVARWKLDETAGLLAHDDIGGHDAALHLATTWAVPGQVGNALSLRQGYAQTMWDLPASAPNAFTIAMWVKLDSRGRAFDRYFSSFYYELDTTFRGSILLDNGDGAGFRCAPYIGGAWHFLQLDNVVTVGAWQHVACTYDGTTIAAYIQGARADMLAASGTFGSTAALPVVIGASVDELDNSQNQAYMAVDDVRVYDRALTPAELAALATP